MAIVLEVLLHAAHAIPLILAAIAILIFGRCVFIWFASYNLLDEIILNENTAVGVVFGGFIFSVGIAVSATVFGNMDVDGWTAAGETLVEGALAVALLRLSVWVNDMLILPRFSIDRELCEDHNLGVAYCVAASCLASGLILNGALSGYSSGGFWFGLLDVCLYWIVGQVLLVIAGRVYYRVSRYDIHHLIEYDDNVAAGLGYGAVLLALGIVLRATLVGAGKEVLVDELIATTILGALGIAFITVVNLFTTKWILPTASYERDVEMKSNLAASVAIAGMTIAAAVFTSVAIQRHESPDFPVPPTLPAEVTQIR
ncbi:MAG: uncharacterized membrane protein YjfL (UPF0719 family) [Pirellulaceae bacterium]|jgi:uncharacterized membrane protein YjfL (UPF0719 family)